MKKIRLIATALLYVGFCQIISFLFARGLGIYWIVFQIQRSANQEDMLSDLSKNFYWGFPFVMMTHVGIALNAIIAVTAVIGYMVNGGSLKEIYFIYAGLVMMIISTVAANTGLPLMVQAVSEVFLWHFIAYFIYCYIRKKPCPVCLPFVIFCISFVFFAGFNMVGHFGVDRTGMTNYLFWLICFIVTLFCVTGVYVLQSKNQSAISFRKDGNF